MHAHRSTKQRLQQVFLLLASYAVVEIAVGLGINSIALQGDGWHMVLDALNYAILWFVAAHAERMTAASQRERMEALGGLIGATTLLPVSFFYLLVTGLDRALHPTSAVISTGWLTATAFVGLVINLWSWPFLSGGSPEMSWQAGIGTQLICRCPSCFRTCRIQRYTARH